MRADVISKTLLRVGVVQGLRAIISILEKPSARPKWLSRDRASGHTNSGMA